MSLLGAESKSNLKPKAALVVPTSVAAVTEAMSGSSDAGNVRLKVLEDLVAGLLKERPPPLVPPLSAPRK